MLIAREKKESNIVEYLLYMYQIEDIIRSFQFNLDAINQSIVEQYDQSVAMKAEISSWYEDLIFEMQAEAIQQKGHLQRLKKVIANLQELHQQLLTTFQDQAYIKLYDAAKIPLKELILKSKGQGLDSEIDLALHGLYGLLVLRLKKQPVGKETEVAMQQVSGFLAHLALQYKKRKEGKLEFSEDRSN